MRLAINFIRSLITRISFICLLFYSFIRSLILFVSLCRYSFYLYSFTYLFISVYSFPLLPNHPSIFIHISCVYFYTIYLSICVLKSVVKRWMTEVCFKCNHSFLTTFYHSFLLFAIFYFILSSCSFHRNDRKTEEQEYEVNMNMNMNMAVRFQVLTAMLMKIFGHEAMSFCKQELKMEETIFSESSVSL